MQYVGAWVKSYGFKFELHGCLIYLMRLVPDGKFAIRARNLKPET
jgi:hypothetical protein